MFIKLHTPTNNHGETDTEVWVQSLAIAHITPNTMRQWTPNGNGGVTPQPPFPVSDVNFYSTGEINATLQVRETPDEIIALTRPKGA